MSAQRPLDGRVAVVTGSSRGIGRAMALRLAREGAAVVITGKSESGTEKLPGSIHTVAAEVEATGGSALPVRVDVRHEDEVEAMEVRRIGTGDAIAREKREQVRGLDGHTPHGDVALEKVRPRRREGGESTVLERLPERRSLIEVFPSPLKQPIVASEGSCPPFAQACRRRWRTRREVERLVLPGSLDALGQQSDQGQSADAHGKGRR